MRYSDNEKITRDTYNQSGGQWMKTHQDRDYWLCEFAIFSWELDRLVGKKGKILDLCCGFGRDCKVFTEAGYEYVGVDFSEGLLEEARLLNPEREFMLANIRNLPFGDESFEGFWAVASLLHIEKENIRKVLLGIRNKLKKKAVGLIVLKEGEGEMIDEGKDWSQNGKRFFAYYGEDEFKAILEDCGFDIIGVRRRKEGKTTVWLEFFVQKNARLKQEIRKLLNAAVKEYGA